MIWYEFEYHSGPASCVHVTGPPGRLPEYACDEGVQHPPIPTYHLWPNPIYHQPWIQVWWGSGIHHYQGWIYDTTCQLIQQQYCYTRLPRGWAIRGSRCRVGHDMWGIRSAWCRVGWDIVELWMMCNKHLLLWWMAPLRLASQSIWVVYTADHGEYNMYTYVLAIL